VEYHVTPFGERFIRVLDEIERLQEELPPKTPMADKTN